MTSGDPAQNHDPFELGQLLHDEALRIGFGDCAAVWAEELAAERTQLEDWLAEGKHGEMNYLAEDVATRADPRLLLEGCKTVVVLTHPYLAQTAPAQGAYTPPEGVPKIARYAWGADYHWVLKTKLHRLAKFIQSQVAEPVQWRLCVDSAPVMERAWAQRAGLGWQGKNTLILNPAHGSYFFLAVLLLDIDIRTPVEPVTDHCGSCTRCIDACPTEALTPYRLDANKCLSYQTIEITRPMDEALRPKTEGWAFGCDICQEVCPWNKFATPTSEPEFQAQRHVDLTADQWRTLTPTQHKRHTRHTALWRNRRDKWLDNLDASQQ